MRIRIKVSTALRILMAVGLYICISAFKMLISSSADVTVFFVMFGASFFFLGLPLILGIVRFGWDDFKDEVLLKISTAIWLILVIVLSCTVEL